MSELVCDGLELIHPLPRFKLTYHDAEWEEVEELCCEDLTPTEASCYVLAWLRATVLRKSSRSPGEHVLGKVACVSLEVQHG